MEKVLLLIIFALPSFTYGLFSAIRGKPVELKTAPNLGILLSGRKALIPVSIILVLALAIRLIELKFHLADSTNGGLDAIGLGVIIVGTFAWARFGGLDFLAHHCLRVVLWRCGYAPFDYVRFLNYAATELGFLQKVGGGYVFMHRYLLEYFAGSGPASRGTADAVADAPAALH